VPIYEYVCTGCGRRIDVRHTIAENGPDTCEVCGGRLRKALTTPTIHFRGSGWAKKDAQSATRSREKQAATEGSAEGTKDATPVAAGAEATSTSGQEAKPASRAESGAAGGAKPASAPATSPAKSPRPPGGKKSGD
jgi:putative FmdB family regulatory protein